MSFSTLLKPKNEETKYIDFYKLKWIKDSNIDIAESVIIRDLFKNKYQTILDNFHIVDNKLMKIDYEKERHIINRIVRQDGTVTWNEINRQKLYSPENIEKYTILSCINDIYIKTDEIKLLNDKIDKLEKNYHQLMINWETITEYMKKIENIEDKIMGKPNPNKKTH